MGNYSPDDFYSGPSPLEALVAGFLDQSVSQVQAKRKREQEAATKAREDADALSIRQSRVADRAEKGFLPASAVDRNSSVPITVPGVGGAPAAQFGVKRYQDVGEGLVRDRVDNPDARTRQVAIDKDATEQTRRDRLSRAVGAALDPSLSASQRSAAIAEAIREDPTQAPALIAQLTPDTPKRTAPSVHGNYTVDDQGVAHPIRDAKGRPVDLSPPTPKVPKDDRAAWERQRYAENLKAAGPGGFGKLYESPEQALEATRREADALFGPAKVPTRAPTAKPVVAPAKVASDEPTLEDLESAYKKRLKRP